MGVWGAVLVFFSTSGSFSRSIASVSQGCCGVGHVRIGVPGESHDDGEQLLEKDCRYRKLQDVVISMSNVCS